MNIEFLLDGINYNNDKTCIRKLGFFGDSLTEVIDLNTNSSLVEGKTVANFNKWAFLVSENLGIESVFAGIGGDTAENMVSRVETDIISHNPSHCIFMAGANDIYIGKTAEATISYVSQVVEKLLYNNIIPIIMWCPVTTFVGKFENTSSASFQEENFNKMAKCYKDLANSKKLNIIDLENVGLGYGYSTDLSTRVADKIHFNIKGSRILSEIVIKYMLNNFPKNE